MENLLYLRDIIPSVEQISAAVFVTPHRRWNYLSYDKELRKAAYCYEI
jgi:hypothetical protein